MTASAQNIVAAQGVIRLSPAPAQYYSFGYGISSVSNQFEDLDDTAFSQGVFFSAGYDSFLGPLEIFLSTPVDRIRVSLFLKAGFKF